MCQGNIISPRLKELKQDLEVRSLVALQKFWEEVEVKGTPLIEKIDGDDENFLLTVLWRDTEKIENVLVFGAIFGGPFGDEKERPELYRFLDTDLWYRTYKVNKDVHSLYFFGLNVPDGPSDYDWNIMDKRLDQFNPKTFSYPRDEENPDDYPLLREVESLLELPNYKANPWSVEMDSFNKGNLKEHRFKSEILSNERRVWVYTPADYSEGREDFHLAIFTDGWVYINLLKGPVIIDNLIEARIIPSTVVIFIESLKNRGTELCCNDSFIDFLTEEILPWINQNYDISNDQSKTMIGGLSLGGLTAAYAGLKRPDIFGKILSQSGGFCLEPNGEVGNGWIVQKYKETPRLPLDFYMNFGIYETYPPMKDSNLEMVKVLKDKGNKVDFQWFQGGHSYEYWGDTLPNGLISLLGKYA